MPKIAAIIPAYNEAENIGGVIREIKEHHPEIKIVVVNDASTDNTEAVVMESGETVLTLAHNLGIGGAVQTGLRYAAENDYDIAIQVDGDGQHIPAEIDKLTDPILAGDADVVIGSRFLGVGNFKSSLSRKLGIRVISLVNSILVGSKTTDNTSGFRAHNKRAIAFLSEHYSQDYPEPVAVIELFRNRFRVMEVPTRMRERERGSSSIGALNSIYYMIKVIMANVIAFSRKPASKEDD
ncbi:MAG: glycosyltransferase family 2 protein [candidate division Zixibacteria bacterium]|jgi:glycosyltransferase involved in cell wall biosynthesis|nr:glycosyltransferase family 2 protein [candidate division Zixibacteria bacterium]